LRASDVMTASPTTVAPDALLLEALSLMENRPSQIYVLPVVDTRTRVCVGLLRLHDIYRGTRP
jgi:arabinose-5-phosphate isomerase